MQPGEFKISASKFIQSIVKQRLYLDSKGLSKNPTAVEDARFMDLHLRAYPNRSADQMAGFWMRSHDKIFNIIPGSRTGYTTKRHDQFEQLHREAKRLFNNHLITPIIKPHVNTHYQAQN